MTIPEKGGRPNFGYFFLQNAKIRKVQKFGNFFFQNAKIRIFFRNEKILVWPIYGTEFRARAPSEFFRSDSLNFF